MLAIEFIAQQQQKRRSSTHGKCTSREETSIAESENANNNAEQQIPFAEPITESSAVEKVSEDRGRTRPNPSKVPMAKRFLQPTAAATSKWAVREQPAPQRSKSIERKLTIPVSPKLRCVSRSRDRVQSTESKELQLVEEAKNRELLRMKRNQRSMEYNKAKSNLPVHNVVRSTKPLTIPTTPCNHLSKRHGEKKYSTTCAQNPVPPSRPKSAPATGPRPLTQPEPFVLKTDARAGAVQLPVEVVLTAGEMCRKFEADPRSHRVPRAATHLTEAMSPKLQTKKRASSTGRPLPKSRETQEAELLEEASNHPFKAKPVDRRIFSSMGELGVPKVAAKPMTVCEEFTFRYNEERVSQRQKVNNSKNDDGFEFKAAPMPDFTVTSGRQHEVKPLTIALSPKLSGGRRASSAPPRRQRPHHDIVAKERSDNELKERARVSRPMTLTEPEEFRLSTSQRGAMTREKLSRKLEEEAAEEQKKRQFKAQKFSNQPCSFIPQPSMKDLTDFCEFHLKTDERHTLSTTRKMQEEQLKKAAEEAERNFRARSVPRAVVDPTAAFKIQKEHKQTTQPETVHLATDERMKKRKLFEKELARKRKAQAEQQRQLELEREKEDLENLNMLRRKPIEEGGLCFKATPVPSSRPATKMVTNEDIKPRTEQEALQEQDSNIMSRVELSALETESL